jgi:hypothetical protein
MSINCSYFNAINDGCNKTMKEELVMATMEVKYREDNSYFIEASDDYAKYIFSSHALDRLFERKAGIKQISDLEKLVQRIVECLEDGSVDDWIIENAFGTSLVIHDVAVKMAYVVVCRIDQYEIVTTFNERRIPFMNSHHSPEYWVLLSKKDCL